MKTFSRFAIVVLVLLAAAGAFFLAEDMPAPTQSVEKVIPNDRFETVR